MIARRFAIAVVAGRDGLARRLSSLGLTPNALTCLGAAITAGAAVCYAVGSGGRFGWSLAAGDLPNAWLLLAGVLMVLSSACDALDGAVARVAGRKTEFGAFLDSTLDRFSDFAVYAGIAIFYVWSGPRANITFILLAMLAFFNAYMISYSKARAEDFIESCGVGFWQRGERCAAILIATFAHNIPALLVQQAILPAFTIWRRISHTRAEIRRKEASDQHEHAYRPGALAKLRLWRSPRGTLGYYVLVAVNIAWLIFARFKPTDMLRAFLGC
ncbi:MAG: CDP-alcohol phosphatidyltransferase family protein [Planctomycetota bacterium]|jgi:CDP-diacylglycerol--glycerol-3-phosphate 3-phosphatidyltransferase